MLDQTKHKPAKRTLTRREAFDLANLVQDKCKLVDGFAYYDDGWSDKRIAQVFSAKIGRPIGGGAAKVIRLEFVGRFKAQGQGVGGDGKKLSERQEELEARVTRLAAAFEAMPPASSLGVELKRRLEAVETYLRVELGAKL